MPFSDRKAVCINSIHGILHCHSVLSQPRCLLRTETHLNVAATCHNLIWKQDTHSGKNTHVYLYIKLTSFTAELSPLTKKHGSENQS